MRAPILDIPVDHSRSPHIDSLRFILAMWVVFTHMVPWVVLIQTQTAIPKGLASVMDWLLSLLMSNSETHPAVLGFIVLSGYCIHRSGMRSPQDGIRAYAIRRFFRIYPVFFISTFFGVGAFLIGASVDPVRVPWVTGTQSLSIIHIIGKLFAVEAVNPLTFFPSIQGNGPLQTVAVEMWLYAVYPLALLFMSRWSERAWWGVMVVCWLASVAITTHVPDWRYWSYNASVIAFLPFWWIGAKFTDSRFASRMRRFVVIPALIWLVLTLSLPFGEHVAQLLAGVRQMAFAVCFACLVSAIDEHRNARGNIFSGLGSGAYSIYAFHAPIVYLMVLLGMRWEFTLCAVVAFGVIASRLIEKPFIRAGKRWVAVTSLELRNHPSTS
jgi:peptidoglycan/LPS O-acetylase OafA/YrhL